MSGVGGKPERPEAPPGMPEPGELIGGKYRIEHVIGQGGMGVVVAARHTTLKRRVALKFLLPAAHRKPQDVARFLREAQAAAAITSEHVAQVIDVGTTEAGLPYIVMEFLRGINVAERIDRLGPFSAEDAVAYVLEVCEAIAEAHALGIVHRDLKPSNLFLAEKEDGSSQIKVIDFGISKALNAGTLDNEGRLTAKEVVLGSPSYMSPEHVRSAQAVDTRTDIWALGVILYEMLTGRLPFHGESPSALFVSIAVDPPTPPRSHRPDIPAALERIILSCLEKRADQRPQTVAELAEVLAPLAPERSRASLERILRSGPGVPTVRARVAAVDARIDVDGDTSKLVERQEAKTRTAPPPRPASEPMVSRIAGLHAVDETAKSMTVRTNAPRRGRNVLLGAAVAALAGLALFALQRRGESEPGPRSEPAQEQHQRLDHACQQSRVRLQNGIKLGPFDTIGWEVDLWLARVGEAGADARPAPDAGAQAPAHEPPGGAGPVVGAPAPPLTAASLGDIATGGRLTPALDAVLSQVVDGTVTVKEASPGDSRALTDITVTFGEGYGRVFFDPEVRPRFIAVAERLYQAAGADAGALYARCARLEVRDVGAWFRGDDPGGATAALLYQMETFAEPPHPTFIALSSLDTAGRLRALRARVRDAWLDDKALRELLVRRGAHVTAAREGTVITFPDDAPLRARVIGRELSDALDPSGHRAR